MGRSEAITITQYKASVVFFRIFNIPIKLAFRDLRGGISSFRIFITCLILGVAAISGVGSISKAMNAGITKDSQRLLGGDFSIQLTPDPFLLTQMNISKKLGLYQRYIICGQWLQQINPIAER